MHKKASRRSGGQPLTGWNKGYGGSHPSLPILTYGEIPFAVPKVSEGAPKPTQAQLRLAAIICDRLKVAVPEVCVETAKGMSAFIDFYKPRLDALRP